MPDTTINAWGFEPDVEGAVINDGCSPYLGCWTSAVVRVNDDCSFSATPAGYATSDGGDVVCGSDPITGTAEVHVDEKGSLTSFSLNPVEVQSPSGDTYQLYFDGRAETQGVLDADFWVPVDTSEQSGGTPCLYYPLTGLFQVVGSVAAPLDGGDEWPVDDWSQPEEDTGLMPEAWESALQDNTPAEEESTEDVAAPSEPEVVLNLESAGGEPVALPSVSTGSDDTPGAVTAFMPKSDDGSTGDSSQLTPEELFTTALPPATDDDFQPLPVPTPTAAPGDSQEVVPPSGPGSETNKDTTQETVAAPSGTTATPSPTMSEPVAKPEAPSSSSSSSPAVPAEGVTTTSTPAAPGPSSSSSPATPMVDCKRHRRALLAPGADDPCAPAKPAPAITTSSSSSSGSSKPSPPVAKPTTAAATPTAKAAASPKPATPTTTVLPDSFAAGVSVGQATTSVTTSRITRTSAAGLPHVGVGLLVAAAAAAAGLGA